MNTTNVENNDKESLFLYIMQDFNNILKVFKA